MNPDDNSLESQSASDDLQRLKLAVQNAGDDFEEEFDSDEDDHNSDELYDHTTIDGKFLINE